MAILQRVTFFDRVHSIGRSVEIQCDSPVDAAVSGLRKFLAKDFFVKDFAAAVKVETINTTEHTLDLPDIATLLTSRDERS